MALRVSKSGARNGGLVWLLALLEAMIWLCVMLAVLHSQPVSGELSQDYVLRESGNVQQTFVSDTHHYMDKLAAKQQLEFVEVVQQQVEESRRYSALWVALFTLAASTLAIYVGYVLLRVSKKENARFARFMTESDVSSVVDKYDNYWEVKENKEKVAIPELADETLETRKRDPQGLANKYYDLVTDFYEFGWGQSFHFAPRAKGESFLASLFRHEYYLAYRMGLKPGTKTLDVGCGVGGPLKNIARFSGAHITGLNNNTYQIARGRVDGLAPNCDFVFGDFNRMPLEDNTFDAVYAIEATVHAPDKVKVFKECFRILKPGGVLGLYEYIMTQKFNSNDPVHCKIKADFLRGGAVPDVGSAESLLCALRESGFEIVESRDLEPESELPWYLPLAGGFSPSGFLHTPAGRAVTNVFVRVLEALRIAPRGSTSVSSLLNKGADAFVRSGELKIFSPLFFLLCRKPL